MIDHLRFFTQDVPSSEHLSQHLIVHDQKGNVNFSLEGASLFLQDEKENPVAKRARLGYNRHTYRAPGSREQEEKKLCAHEENCRLVQGRAGGGGSTLPVRRATSPRAAPLIAQREVAMHNTCGRQFGWQRGAFRPIRMRAPFVFPGTLPAALPTEYCRLCSSADGTDAQQKDNMKRQKAETERKI